MARSARSGESGRPQRALFGELERRSVFKDLSVFDTDYIPEHIFVRKEFNPIVRFYFDALKSSLQQTMIIVGPSGSGKTLACRYYAEQAQRYANGRGPALSSAYVNCREVARYAFWQILLSQFGAPAPKGLSVADLLGKLAEALSGRRHVVVILDELEKLFTLVGPERANDILYNLVRLRANRNLDTAISTVFVSNNAHLSDWFDGPVKSSLNVRNLPIGHYDAQELVGILTDRARAGLKPRTWDHSVVSYTAAKTVQYNSDARFAIRLLSNAARRFEGSHRSRMSTEHVDAAFQDTRQQMEVEVLNKLSVSQLLVLEALAHKARITSEQFIGLHQAYKETYPGVCDQAGRKPLVYSHFLNTVNALQSYDLVKSILERRRTGGYVRRVEINFDPADVIRVAGERLGV